MVFGWDSVTANRSVLGPKLPSTTDALPIDTRTAVPDEVSSFVTVPVPVARRSVTPCGLVRFTLNASFGSTVRSPLTGMVTIAEVTPAGMVRIPDLDVKSVPAVAVPEAVEYVTDVAPTHGFERETVKRTWRVPALPSTTDAFPIDASGSTTPVGKGTVSRTYSCRFVLVPRPLMGASVPNVTYAPFAASTGSAPPDASCWPSWSVLSRIVFAPLRS